MSETLISDDPTGAERIAATLAGLVRQSYDDGVEITTRLSTVTVARGRRAAQIQVLDDRHFVVALRRNQTFHMRPDPVGREEMVALIEHMVGLKDDSQPDSAETA